MRRFFIILIILLLFNAKELQAEYVQAWSINVDDLMKEALSLDY